MPFGSSPAANPNPLSKKLTRAAIVGGRRGKIPDRKHVLLQEAGSKGGEKHYSGLSKNTASRLYIKMAFVGGTARRFINTQSQSQWTSIDPVIVLDGARRALLKGLKEAAQESPLSGT